ncbi:hypothetical protein [Clostridium mediterraneense]|uniref:hypothetical protein n=1 Tax=Clostridium mediterraneense TaxID=1805472 RepID=UPI00082D8E7B|nr:hypothetical protein [Clostridium mediterraneense]
MNKKIFFIILASNILVVMFILYFVSSQEKCVFSAKNDMWDCNYTLTRVEKKKVKCKLEAKYLGDLKELASYKKIKIVKKVGDKKNILISDIKAGECQGLFTLKSLYKESDIENEIKDKKIIVDIQLGDSDKTSVELVNKEK